MQIKTSVKEFHQNQEKGKELQVELIDQLVQEEINLLQINQEEEASKKVIDLQLFKKLSQPKKRLKTKLKKH